MFRLQEQSIEPDPSFPVDLEALGYFINSAGHIRRIDAPDKPYIFRATNDDRNNEVLREAMQECSRVETEKRLTALGISRIYLPDFTTDKPNSPHVAILAPPPDILKTRKRIVVIVNDSIQDLGILAYRQLQRELGLNGASVVDFAKELIKRTVKDTFVEKYNDIFEDGFEVDNKDDIPGLIVMNTGQLLYSYKYNKSMTLRSWSAMPRKSAVHEMIRIHEQENRISGHRDPQEHIQSVFDDILCNPDRVAPNAEVYLIAIENGADHSISLLTSNFAKYGTRISAMAIIYSLVDISSIKDSTLRAFLHQRAREWQYSGSTTNPLHCTKLPPGFYAGEGGDASQDDTAISQVPKRVAWNEQIPSTSFISGITTAVNNLVLSAMPVQDATLADSANENSEWSSGDEAICPTFSGGENATGECVFTNPAVQHAILSFFDEVAQDPENYRNPHLIIQGDTSQHKSDDGLTVEGNDVDLAEQPHSTLVMTMEQAEVNEAKVELQQMTIALEACPGNVPELEKGRKRLIERVVAKKAEVDELEQKALSHGSLQANEGVDKRKKWMPQKEGPKIKFAGTMIDSELLKAAGFGKVVEEELQKMADE